MRALRTLTRRLAGIWRALESKLLMLVSNDLRIRRLRARGVRIGENCLMNTTHVSTEPYLIQIGNHVAVSAGTKFVTHDASGWLFEDTDPAMDVFGPITVGDNTFFGLDCLILPNTRIGSNCIIGSGAVVRGNVPDGSVVMGNPGRVVMKTALVRPLLRNHKNRLDSRHLPPQEKKQLVQRHFGLS